jgi:hypothetical protein
MTNKHGIALVAGALFTLCVLGVAAVSRNHKNLVESCKKIPIDGDFHDVENFMLGFSSQKNNSTITEAKSSVIVYMTDPSYAEVPRVWMEDSTGLILIVSCDEDYQKYSRRWLSISAPSRGSHLSWISGRPTRVSVH